MYSLVRCRAQLGCEDLERVLSDLPVVDAGGGAAEAHRGDGQRATVGVVVVDTLDLRVAATDSASLEELDRAVVVVLDLETPLALHHLAAGGDLGHVLPRVFDLEFALDLGLHCQALLGAVDGVLERGASVARDRDRVDVDVAFGRDELVTDAQAGVRGGGIAE